MSFSAVIHQPNKVIDKDQFKDNSFSFTKENIDKKYNVKFDNEDLDLLNEIQTHYGIKSKSDLIHTVLVHYFKKSLNAKGVAKDVALIISLVADAYAGSKGAFDVSTWAKEVISQTSISQDLLDFGPAAKKIKLSSHNGVEHSESYVQVGMKLMQFCERENLLSTPEYKRVFKSLESWIQLNKSSRSKR